MSVPDNFPVSSNQSFPAVRNEQIFGGQQLTVFGMFVSNIFPGSAPKQYYTDLYIKTPFEN
jgi:hypothetical protein